jgi:PAS domain S-box-containing protein
MLHENTITVSPMKDGSVSIQMPKWLVPTQIGLWFNFILSLYFAWFSDTFHLAIPIGGFGLIFWYAGSYVLKSNAKRDSRLWVATLAWSVLMCLFSYQLPHDSELLILFGLNLLWLNCLANWRYIALFSGLFLVHHLFYFLSQEEPFDYLATFYYLNIDESVQFILIICVQSVFASLINFFVFNFTTGTDYLDTTSITQASAIMTSNTLSSNPTVSQSKLFSLWRVIELSLNTLSFEEKQDEFEQLLHPFRERVPQLLLEEKESNYQDLLQAMDKLALAVHRIQLVSNVNQADIQTLLGQIHTFKTAIDNELVPTISPVEQSNDTTFNTSADNISADAALNSTIALADVPLVVQAGLQSAEKNTATSSPEPTPHNHLGYLILNGNGVVIQLNSRAADYLGVDTELIVNRPITDYFEEAEAGRTFINRLFMGVEVQEINLMSALGARIRLTAYGSLTDGGTMNGVAERGEISHHANMDPAYLLWLLPSPVQDSPALQVQDATIEQQLVSYQQAIEHQFAELQLAQQALADTQSAIELKEMLLAEIVKHLPFAFFAKDANDHFKYTLTNDSAETLFGINESMLGLSAKDLMPEHVAEKYIAEDQKIMANQQVVSAHRLSTNDIHQQQRVINYHKVPIIDRNHSIAYLVGLAEDVSKTVQLEQAFMEMVQTIGVPICIIDSQDATIVLANSAWLSLFGYETTQLLKQPMANVSADVHAWVIQHAKSNTNTVEAKEFRYTHQEGHVLTFNTNLLSIDLDGTAHHILQLSQYQSIEHFSTDESITPHLSQEKLLNELANTLKEAILVIDGEGKILAANQASERLFSLSNSDLLGSRFIDLVASDFHQLVEPIVTANQLEWKEVDLELEVLIAKGNPLTVDVSISEWKAGDQKRYSIILRDISPLKAREKITQQLNGDLRLREAELAQNLAQLKESQRLILETQTKLQEREQYLNTIFEGSNDAIVLFNSKGFIDCNSAAVRLYGCKDKADFLSHKLGTFTPPLQPNGIESAELSKSFLTIVQETGTHNFEWLHHRLDGTPFLTEFRVSMLTLGNEQLMMAMVHDIGERKSIEDDLRGSEALLNQFSTNLSGLLLSFVLRPDSKIGITFVSHRCEEIFGYKPAEIRNVFSNRLPFIIHPDHEQEMIQALRNSKNTLQPFNWIGQIKTKHVPYHWYQINGTPRLLPDDSIEWTAIITLIDQIIEAQQAIQQSEERANEAMRLARLGRWEYDILKEKFYFDKNFWKIIDKEDTSELPELTLPTFIQQFVPTTDVPLIELEIQRLLNYEGKEDYSSSFSFDLKVKEGELKRVLVLISGIKSSSGRLLKAVGTVQDISDKVKQEAALIQSEARLNEAMQIARLGMWELDILRDEIYLDRNHWLMIGSVPRNPKNYRLPFTEFIQRFALPNDAEAFVREVQALRDFVPADGLAEYNSNFSFSLLCTDGSTKKTQVSLRGIKGNKGTLVKAVGTTQDITENKRQEEALRASQALLLDSMLLSEMGIWELHLPTQELMLDSNMVRMLELSEEVNHSMTIPLEQFLEMIQMESERQELSEALSTLLQALSSDEIASVEYQLKTPIQNTRYFITILRPILDDKGGVSKIIGTSQNITERKTIEIERLLTAEQKRILDQSLLSISRSEVVTSGDSRAAYAYILQSAAETLEVAHCGVWLFNPNNFEQLCAGAYFSKGKFMEEKDLVIDREDYPVLFEEIFKEECIAAQYAKYDPRISELRDSYYQIYHVTSVIITPIRRSGRIIGVLSVEHMSASRKWQDFEIAYTQSIAENINLAIEAKERSEALEALRVSDATFKALSANSPGVIFQAVFNTYKKFKYQYVSPTIHNLLEVEPEAVIKNSQTVQQLIAPDDLQAFNQFIQDAVKSMQPFRWEGRFILPIKNIEKWIQIVGRPEMLRTGDVLFNGIFLDITEEKKAAIVKDQLERRKQLHANSLNRLSRNENINNGDFEPSMMIISQAVAQTLYLHRVGVWFFDSNGIELSAQIIFNSADETFPSKISFNQDQALNLLTTLSKDEPCVVEYAHLEPNLAEVYETYFSPEEISSVLSVPIVRKAMVVGVVLAEHKGPAREWNIDEIGYLESASEIITLLLEAKERKEALISLQQKEAELSQTVNQRTKALEELKAAQKQLVQNEKMASLGQLVAGVAHEINTPISAVKASTRNAIRALSTVLIEVPQLLRNLSDEDVHLFMQMINQSVETNVEYTTQEERDYRITVKAILDENDIEESYELAKELVEVRIIDNIEKYIPLFEHEQSSILIDKIYKLGQFKKNLDNIEVAADKTARVARALKNYSHFQSSDSFVEIFLHDSVELILTIYQNQIKYGVALEKNYDKTMKPIQALSDEIGQVWTNIISNAIYAMKGNGKLIINVYQKDDYAYVQLTDDGPGIPKDILERIFDPFFTTKPQGEGTGLGLDICRKIIDKHNGEIRVESEPGRTMFEIKLPFVQPLAQPEQK